MAIVPLPVFEEEADPRKRGLTDEEIAQYERLTPPESVVVRYGRMRMIGEFPCKLEVTPGCGTKFVVRTPRGIEIGEMLTTTCANSGCGKAISRKEMLNYIEESGGKKYPFTTKGRVIRVATNDDLNEMSAIEKSMAPSIRRVREVADELNLEMKIIDVEPVLSQDHLTVYYMSEDRVDFRTMVRNLAREFSCRIEMRQVGARDEARIKADYERCGQHCCCRQFLKVLKPVPMRAAKMQKATLDPLKISGRCGRLMCCLRYEDASYVELKKRLPHKKTRVGTPHGAGIVLDTQILTQLVLVEIEHDRAHVAVPVENLMDPEKCPRPWEVEDQPAVEEDPYRGLSPEEVEARTNAETRRSRRGGDKSASKEEQQDEYRKRSKREHSTDADLNEPADAAGDVTETHETRDDDQQSRRRKKRRGRRGGKGRSRTGPTSSAQNQPKKVRKPNRPTESGAGQDGGNPVERANENKEGATGGESKRKRSRRRGKRGGRNRRKGKGGAGGGGNDRDGND